MVLPMLSSICLSMMQQPQPTYPDKPSRSPTRDCESPKYQLFSSSSWVNLGSSLNAMAVSPTGKLIAAGGRDALQLVTVQLNSEPISLELSRNMRAGRANLSSSANDIGWQPQTEHCFATAAANGNVVLWNLNSQRVQERVWTAHERAVNRLCWHPQDINVLISGSMDGKVMLWDVREEAEPKQIMVSHSEGVRDVQFNPFNPNAFAAAYDNGSVLIWDIRHGSKYEQRITAHEDHVFSLSWHGQSKNILATGGRDCMVKVWDIARPSSPTHTLETICSISQVRWRPGYPDQIATASQPSMPVDCDVHVWDVTRPYTPVMSFHGHKAAASGIQWAPHTNHLFSCSKDGLLIAHDIEHCSRPHSHLSVQPIDWSINRIVTVLGHVDRNYDPNEPTNSSPSTFGHPNTSPRPLRAEQPRTRTPSLTIPSPLPEPQPRIAFEVAFASPQDDGSMDLQLVDYFAENYILDAGSFSFADCCMSNARVAASRGKASIAHTWAIVGQLFAPTSEGTDLAYPVGAAWPHTVTRVNANVEERRESHQLDVIEPSTLVSSEEMFEQFGAFHGIFDEDSSDAASVEGTEPAATVGNRYTAYAPESIHGKEKLQHDFLPSLAETMAQELVQFYAELGNVQMCVSLVVLLRGRVEFPTLAVKEWFLGYIEILLRLQLWDNACEIIGLCPDEDLNRLNRQSTFISLGCGSCSRSLPSDTPYATSRYDCDSCGKRYNSCSICQLPVKGAFSWCRMCGHGGHLGHIQSWFTRHQECPSGCSCKCNHGELLGEEALSKQPNWQAGHLRVNPEQSGARVIISGGPSQ